MPVCELIELQAERAGVRTSLHSLQWDLWPTLGFRFNSLGREDKRTKWGLEDNTRDMIKRRSYGSMLQFILVWSVSVRLSHTIEALPPRRIKKVIFL